MPIKEPLFPEFRLFVGGLRGFKLRADKTALLIVDVQKLFCHREYGIGRRMHDLGLHSALEDYFCRLDRAVAQILELRQACRQAAVAVIYSHIAGRTDDGRDLSPLMRHHGLVATRHSQEREILDELRPEPGDTVISRSTISVFTPQITDQLLRNMGISTLILVGVLTDLSIESTARDAGDRGYQVIVVSDGCAALTVQDHRAALEPLDYLCAHVNTTAEVLRALKSDGEIT